MINGFTKKGYLLRMKRFIVLIALLTLTLGVLTLAGCDLGSSGPSDIPVEDTTETDAPETEVETTLADLSAADALNQILGMGGEDSSEQPADASMDVDMTVSMGYAYGTAQNTTTLPVKLTVINDGDKVQVTGTLMGQKMGMIYAEGVLYVDFPVLNKKFKCAITPEEFKALLTRLNGDSAEGENTEFRISDVFSTVVSDWDEGSGELHIVGKGINAGLIPRVAPYIVPVLSTVGFVGGHWTEDGYEMDEEKALAQVMTLLEGVSEDTLSVTFVADAKGVLRSVSVDVTMVLDESDESGIKKTAINFTGTATVTPAPQTVNPPSDVSGYTDVAPEDLFDEFFLIV